MAFPKEGPWFDPRQARKGSGVLSRIGDHILQEIKTLYLTGFRTYKMLDHPKQRPCRGGSLRQMNTCRKDLYRSFFRLRHFALVFVVN